MAFGSQIDEIKNKLDVVEIIGSYVKLKKTGANWRGVCPFHNEKTPSFFVSPARQMWHCFGCGEGSSIFDFVMKIEGIEFGDALRILAQKAGVQLKRQDPKLITARQRLYEICEFATLFFEKQLEASTTGMEARKYLLGRGINEDSIKKWRLGYSPEVWQGLCDFLVGKGFTREEIERAGLAIRSEKTKNHYDRFRGRIMFPVFDLNSQVIGFGGRVFKKIEGEDGVAKYINVPQTVLYDKSATLYGLNFGKLSVRKQNKCVVTEGYTDVIMAHQSGFDNTVACSGTALTGQHLIILKRYTENLVLAFDMDVAGDSATKRGIDLAQEQGFNIKIIGQSEKDSDPADVIQKNPADWGKAVEGARSILDYYFDSALQSYNKETPDGKKHIGKILLPVIKRMPNAIEQSFWVQKLATTLSVKENVILEEMVKVKVETEEIADNAAPAAAAAGAKCLEFISSVGRRKMLEEKIISLILKDINVLNLINPECLPLFSEKVRKFLEDFKGFVAKSPEGEKGDFKKIILDFSEQYKEGKQDENLKNFLSALALRAEVEYEEDSEEEIQLCLSELKSIELRDKLKKVSEELKKAEQSKDSSRVNVLIEEFNKLSKEL